MGAGAQEVPAKGQVLASDERLASASNDHAGPGDEAPKVAVTDADRAAVMVTRYDLDVHLTPGMAGLEARAGLVVKNVSAAPVERVVLDVSSTLRWESVTGHGFTQSPVQTDADHTGYAQEVVIGLGRPLGAGESVSLTVFYGGKVEQSGARLELIGANATAARQADWDAVQATTDDAATSLRGFGNVMWYPVAAPVALLGEEKKLPDLVARMAYQNQGARLKARVTVEYAGDPPDGVVLDGEVAELAKTPDDTGTLIGDSEGVATAEFAERAIGYRNVSLFLTAAHPVTTEDEVVESIAPHAEAAEPWVQGAEKVKPMLAEWFGPAPLKPMLLLEHDGQVYEDGAMVVAPLRDVTDPDVLAAGLVRAMTHAWFQIGGAQNAWLDQGLPEFMRLLYLERTAGRGAVVEQLTHAGVLLALVEPGTALVKTEDQAFLRLKSAAVLWQLRDIVGEDVLRTAVAGFRHSLFVNAGLADDVRAFERAVEKASGKDLGWFFADWVYADKGLPDLSIGLVSPRALPVKGGKDGGYLVAIEVKNAGDAAAEVPVTVKANGVSATERLRVPAHGAASTRVVFETTPERVEVNDGTVPEMRSSTHAVDVRVTEKP